MKRLYRCRHDRRIAGVAGGVAEYFELDPTLVRIVWFLSMFFGLVTLVVYIGMAIIVPLEPESAGASMAAAVVEPGHRHSTGGTGRWTTFFGIVLVLFGTLALLDVALPNVSWRLLWPVFIAGIGAVLIAGSLRPAAPTIASAGTAGISVANAGVVPAPAPAAPAASDAAPVAAPLAAPAADEPADPLTETSAG